MLVKLNFIIDVGKALDVIKMRPIPFNYKKIQPL
jgi:hypothetical protein